MQRQQRARRAAAAVAATKIKNDAEAFDISEAKAKRRKSSKSGAPSQAAKVAKKDSSKGQSKASNTESKKEQESQKVAPPESKNPHPSSNNAEDTARDARHKEHMRRRSLREVHSNKPKRLSRNTSLKIKSERVSTPVYSPVYALKLKLTPDADASCL